MLSIQDYISSIKTADKNNFADCENKTQPQSYNAVQNLSSKNDSFEKEDNKTNNKINKKKAFKITAIITGIGLAILAFFKRKQIGELFSNIFRKKPSQAPTPPNNDILTNPKTPPATPPTKPTQSLEPKIQPNANVSKPIEEIKNGAQKIIKEIPVPTFGDNPTILEQQQYVSKVLEYINSIDNQDLIIQALDKIQQYGTAEDLEKINAYVWMYAKEPLIIKLSQTVGLLGRKNIDDVFLLDYVSPTSKLSYDAYAEVFKAASKICACYDDREYGKLIKHLNNIPFDEKGDFTQTLTELLISVGKKEYISKLGDYLRNFGYVNAFKNKGEKTPQSVLSVIEKVKEGLEKKG